jgi:hypothetical protein
VDQVVMHFAMDGLILLKESPEAMDQIEVRLSGRWVNVGYGGLFFFFNVGLMLSPMFMNVD